MTRISTSTLLLLLSSFVSAAPPQLNVNDANQVAAATKQMAALMMVRI